VRCNTADQRLNHAVVNTVPLQLPDAKLPLPPYVLGVWLGDGHPASSRFPTADPDIVSAIEVDGLRCTSHSNLLYTLYLPEPEISERACVVCGARFIPRTSQVKTCGRSCGGRSRFMSLRVAAPACPDCGEPSTFGFRACMKCRLDHGTVTARLRGLGVLNNKHIPRAYLRASERQRRQLLAGLLDTDGTVSPTGATQFSVTNERLARDTYELIVSLGYRCGVTTKRVRGRTPSSSTAFTLTFSPPETVFRLPRKKQMHHERVHRRSPVVRSRFITAVRPAGSVPVRCIQVANDQGMFLASRSMIPTHNSTLGLDIARSAAIKHSLPSVIFSLEMSRNEITMRLLSAEARVALHHMRSGTMSDDDWARLARRMGEVSSAPLYIDDSPNMSMMEIRAKCRRLKQRHDLRLVIVDYMQLMSSAKRVENRQQEVSEFSRSMKLLAKELDVPVVAISQLNRGPEQRQDKRPLLSDLRESGSIEQDSDMVILLHREDAYERESPRAGEADLIVAKHRNGPTATITVAFQGHYSRFVDMAQS
jgi:replicative DNA helicase